VSIQLRYTREMKLKVIGLDPGTINMGYGIMSFDSNHFDFVECSFIHCSQKQRIEERLYRMSEQLDVIFKKHRPDHVALERVFLGKNVQSAFKVGQAFGVGLYQSKKWSCSVFDYSTRTVKKALTGTGAASKESVYSCLQIF